MDDDEQLLGGWAENEDAKNNQAYGSFIKGSKPQTQIKVQNRLNKNLPAGEGSYSQNRAKGT